MVKVNFLKQVSYLCQKATFLNFMVMQTRKPENKGTLFREYWTEKVRKRTEQD